MSSSAFVWLQGCLSVVSSEEGASATSEERPKYVSDVSRDQWWPFCLRCLKSYASKVLPYCSDGKLELRRRSSEKFLALLTLW